MPQIFASIYVSFQRLHTVRFLKFISTEAEAFDFYMFSLKNVHSCVEMVLGEEVRVVCEMCGVRTDGTNVDKKEITDLEKYFIDAIKHILSDIVAIKGTDAESIQRKNELSVILARLTESKRVLLDIDRSKSIVFRIRCPDLGALKNLAVICRDGTLEKAFEMDPITKRLSAKYKWTFTFTIDIDKEDYLKALIHFLRCECFSYNRNIETETDSGLVSGAFISIGYMFQCRPIH